MITNGEQSDEAGKWKQKLEIPIKTHNGSTYDYNFIIQESAEEFKGQFESLGENTEKYITFSIAFKKIK